MKVFSEILKYDHNTIRTALGEFGLSLYKFSENLDINHFGIKDIPITADLSDKLCQVLALVDYSLRNGLELAVSGLDKFYNKNIPVDVKNLDKKFIRLGKNKQQIEFLRKSKKVYEISLIGFYEKPSLIWNNLPDDFDIYSRHSESYKDIIKEANLKASRYKQLGCFELCNNIICSIENIKKSMEDAYCGFHKISIRNASIILSKINGFSLVKKDNLDNIFDQKYIISLNKNSYGPKIYPLHYLESIFTDSVKKTISELENPCFFDYYMVLVPSVKSDSQDKDLENIHQKNIVPVILGEKDGICYFISYWT